MGIVRIDVSSLLRCILQQNITIITNEVIVARSYCGIAFFQLTGSFLHSDNSCTILRRGLVLTQSLGSIYSSYQVSSTFFSIGTESSTYIVKFTAKSFDISLQISKGVLCFNVTDDIGSRAPTDRWPFRFVGFFSSFQHVNLHFGNASAEIATNARRRSIIEVQVSNSG